MKSDKLVACHECDLLLQRPPRLRALAAHCPRCRARVSGAAHSRRSLDRLCALTVAALVTCCVAQAFPIVALDAAGIASHATLGDAVLALEDVMNFAADKARCRDENPQALSER
ncbi:paraquat-inducible protein A, partial [Burkholderia ubonensis]|uniref:paraquat-inducible protein A n=1 Tax=Burkholderia ubonensis TaxID=101571 RepID=UPI000B17E0F9